ncbi:MAG: nucleotidyltransferase family protein [Sporichthyaceae bacterium]
MASLEDAGFAWLHCKRVAACLVGTLRARSGHLDCPVEAVARRGYGHGAGMMVAMELRPGVAVDEAALSAFAAEHGVTRLLLFGSVLREDFRADSDVDILIEFLPGRVPGLLRLAEMELELEGLLGRTVELRTRNDLSRHIRDRVMGEARPIYAA